jgi:hypothetical protein
MRLMLWHYNMCREVRSLNQYTLMGPDTSPFAVQEWHLLNSLLRVQVKSRSTYVCVCLRVCVLACVRVRVCVCVWFM